MKSEDFFSLLDSVLLDAGRDPLVPGSPQQAIIEVRDSDRVLQILAGPGSGKTEMLVWRILYEIFARQTPADRLLVTTFTKKAATELEVRLVERADAFISHAKLAGIEAVDPRIHDLSVGTLHSLCDQLLREFDDEYIEAGTRLIDEHESTVRIAREYRYGLGYESRGGGTARVINRLIDREALTALFRAPWDSDSWPSSNMDRVSYIRALIDQHTETWIPRCSGSNTPNGVEWMPGGDGVTEDLVKLQDRWAAYLDGQNVLDFATVQLRFLERQSVLLDKFDHIFVDEFQDTNPIQYAIHRGWVQADSTRLTVVGDDDQSIYRFRGSDISCFIELGDHCVRDNVAFRREVLEVNYRSTKNIVGATERFRRLSALAPVTMDKTLRPADAAQVGAPVRLLVGPWGDLCSLVAQELRAHSIEYTSRGMALDAAVLLFSTSERESRYNSPPAVDLRAAMEARGTRVNNPRNKTAGSLGSPVHDLIALISYFVDPVGKARVNGGRPVEVHATSADAARRPFAVAVPPAYPISPAHVKFQKQFRKSDGGRIDRPSSAHKDLLDFLDDVRDRLADDSRPARLTLAGLVARLLTFPRYRQSGYTVSLFRQTLFTSLLEANVAPTRRTMRSLDQPLAATRTADGKVEWPKEYWDLLNIFAGMLDATTLDDEEVEAFAENAVSMLTFHQAKGLEFDHVYVASTGRDINPDTAIRTAVFSGKRVKYGVLGGHSETDDDEILRWAAADRDREVYVALTRAKKSLTVLHDPDDSRHNSALNSAFAQVFDCCDESPYASHATVRVRSFEVDGSNR